MIEGWRPTLQDGDGALYEKIIDALDRDMREGVLEPGTKLPPQRNLAYALGVSVGTVTKAYVEAERRGLVSGHVGRGTYVGAPGAEAREDDPERVIDLSINVVPHQPASARFASSLAALKRRSDLIDSLAYASPIGQEAHRRAAGVWLERIANLRVDPARTILTSGAQQAMALAFGAICKPGSSILCESATFYGMKSLAEHAGYRLHGLDMDDEGLRPADLERAVKQTGSKVLYVMPTAQNPTGRTMGKKRRTEIARLIRKHELWVVEDDNYALFAPKLAAGLSPLAGDVPERCFYVGGVSKSVAPGLRLGFLVCPDEASSEAVVRAIRATVYTPSSFGGMLFSHWIEDGSAFEIADAVKSEVAARCEVAKDILAPTDGRQVGSAPHFWLSMPELDAERVAGRALRNGVAITPPNAPIVPPTTISGLRVCIGGVASVSELAMGLRRLQGALAPESTRANSGIV